MSLTELYGELPARGLLEGDAPARLQRIWDSASAQTFRAGQDGGASG